MRPGPCASAWLRISRHERDFACFDYVIVAVVKRKDLAARREANATGLTNNGRTVHWGENEFKANELLPLREKDIEEAARSENIDATAYRRSATAGCRTASKQAGHAKILLNIYRRHGLLPQTRSELYLEGCRHLCEEPNLGKSSWQGHGEQHRCWA